jgi:hypothetical protein
MLNNALALQFGTGINYATPRDVYPSAPGASTAQIASAQTPYTTDVVAASDSAVVEGPGGMNGNGNGNGGAAGSSRGAIMMSMLTIIALFVALGFVGNKLGGREGQTGVSNLKLSGYNIAFIGLASIIFIGLAKIIFTRIRVPGVSTWVAAL